MKLNLIAPINKVSYGIVSRNLLRELALANHEVALCPIGPIEYEIGEQTIIEKARQRALTYYTNVPCLKIWHQNDLGMSLGRGWTCGYTFFELDRFNNVEKHHMNAQDYLFVGSTWAKKVVEDNGITTPCFVASPGVNMNVFRPLEKEQTEKTRFLNVGKWELRKGHDILVKAFNLAFNPSDSVELTMACYNPFLGAGNGDWENMYMLSKMGRAGKIKLLRSRLDTQAELAILMNEADCGVFPSRAEGWNLPLLEMMACGKQVITSNYSAHTEFCNSANSLLIDYKQGELAHDGRWFFKENGGSWMAYGKDEVDQLVTHLRSVHANKQGSNHLGIETAKRFSWNATAESITKVLTFGDKSCHF